MITIETIHTPNQRGRYFFKLDKELFYIGEDTYPSLEYTLKHINELKLCDFKSFCWRGDYKCPINQAYMLLDEGFSIIKSRRYCIRLDNVYKNFYSFSGLAYKDGKWLSFCYIIYSKEMIETLKGIVKQIPLIKRKEII